MILDNKDKIINLYNELYYKTRDFTYAELDKLNHSVEEELLKTYLQRLFIDLKSIFIYEVLTSKYVDKYDFQIELQRLYFEKTGSLLNECHLNINDECDYYLSVMSSINASFYEIIKKIIK